jgi:hypothetical protein
MHCKLISINEIPLAQEKENKISQHLRPWLLCKLLTTAPVHKPSHWTLEGLRALVVPSLQLHCNYTVIGGSSRIWSSRRHTIAWSFKKTWVKKKRGSDTTEHRPNINSTINRTKNTNQSLIIKSGCGYIMYRRRRTIVRQLRTVTVMRKLG